MNKLPNEPRPLIECVPNFSEGRDPSRIAALLSELGSVPNLQLLHVTSDSDHNRTVITFAGPPASVLEAAVRLARTASRLIDLTQNKGVHPRIGALDVLPFVPLGGATLADCIALAHQAGHRIWQELGIPVYFYEAAALQPGRSKLEYVRRGEFEHPTQLPDLGGPALHPIAGATIVGARQILIAYNVNLLTEDLAAAKSIARSVRTSSGGLPAVKALGLSLSSQGLVQVSMNLTDYEVTSIEQAYDGVVRFAKKLQVEVKESELIGLAPAAALDQSIAERIKLKDFSPDRIIENRLATAGKSV